ncbi:Glyoxalase-like domain-containing protein [Tardiphaga sp. OK246]|uniref:VOC family protein n=1 Tax=Tardiphaga sp. OK246 TaxID=1855307 RepID=UPI000B631DF9|nr:VOC family protein [Tardiphaga sp. OK246]SNT32540.1 Glyoxalase-like domain-containing protein [Tardiphaga sp. OK246]
MFALDHITVGALTLEDGLDYVEKALGIKVPQGGSHALMGTHNHLMQLGKGLFLEVIAPDPALTPQRPRWFGLDGKELRAQLERSPRLITWVIRTDDVARVIKQLNDKDAEAVRVSRGTLSWLISVAPDGSMPLGGAFPTFIQWPHGPHPAEKMGDCGCSLERLEVSHPQANRITDALNSLNFGDARLSYASGESRLLATIRTPVGQRTLS